MDQGRSQSTQPTLQARGSVARGVDCARKFSVVYLPESLELEKGTTDTDNVLHIVYIITSD